MAPVGAIWPTPKGIAVDVRSEGQPYRSPPAKSHTPFGCHATDHDQWIVRIPSARDADVLGQVREFQLFNIALVKVGTQWLIQGESFDFAPGQAP